MKNGPNFSRYPCANRIFSVANSSSVTPGRAISNCKIAPSRLMFGFSCINSLNVLTVSCALSSIPRTFSATASASASVASAGAGAGAGAGASASASASGSAAWFLISSNM